MRIPGHLRHRQQYQIIPDDWPQPESRQASNRNTSAFSLAHKTAILTGGASGIGRAIATRFAAHGAAIEILDLQPAALDTVTAALRAAGYTADGETCDVSDPASVDGAFARILTRHQRIDILPGRIHTPFVDGFIAKNYPGRESEMFEKLSKTQPIGRMG